MVNTVQRFQVLRRSATHWRGERSAELLCLRRNASSVLAASCISITRMHLSAHLNSLGQCRAGVRTWTQRFCTAFTAPMSRVLTENLEALHCVYYVNSVPNKGERTRTNECCKEKKLKKTRRPINKRKTKKKIGMGKKKKLLN